MRALLYLRVLLQFAKVASLEQFKDPEVISVWLCLAPVADITKTQERLHGSRVLPGNTPVSAVPQPAILLNLRYMNPVSLAHRTGPYLLNPVHW
jgi:hypothetical protein